MFVRSDVRGEGGRMLYKQIKHINYMVLSLDNTLFGKHNQGIEQVYKLNSYITNTCVLKR